MYKKIINSHKIIENIWAYRWIWLTLLVVERVRRVLGFRDSWERWWLKEGRVVVLPFSGRHGLCFRPVCCRIAKTRAPLLAWGAVVSESHPSPLGYCGPRNVLVTVSLQCCFSIESIVSKPSIGRLTEEFFFPSFVRKNIFLTVHPCTCHTYLQQLLTPLSSLTSMIGAVLPVKT